MSNYIYGKVKRKPNLFRIIETDLDVYNLEGVELNGVEYQPGALVEEDELFQVTRFSTKEFFLDFLSVGLDSVNQDQISRVDLTQLSFICVVQANFYCFQIINSSYFISKKWFSIDELALKTEQPIITISPYADAIYDRNTDTLYFKKLTAAQKIFKGMDQLYREATLPETEAFFENDFLNVAPGFTPNEVSIPNRKRIALVNETFNNLDVQDRQRIYDYISHYGHVAYENGRFEIESDSDLKFLLWGLQQRFYTTIVGSENRVANSIITL